MNDDEISVADIQASDRLAGRETTEAERGQMAKSLTELRAHLRAIRQHPDASGGEPAVQFAPLSAAVHAAKNRGEPRSAARHGSPLRRAPLRRARLRRFDAIESLAFAPMADLARLLRARKITSTQLTEMYLARLRRFGPALQCVVTLTEKRARAAATRADHEIAAGNWRGPLHGVPYGVKDLLATRDYPTTWGAPPYQDQQFDGDALVIERLDAAGAVLCAKLSVGELAMGDVWFGGTTRNPWQPETGSSGSSAGSAAAVAAGLIGFAIGTETLGSIISPCVVCGASGLRPTFGSVSRHGAMALSWTMDKIGPIARGIEDLALIFAAIHEPDVAFRWQPNAALQNLRVGIDTRAWESVRDNETLAPIYDNALNTLQALGVTPLPVQLPEPDDASGALPWIIIRAEGAAAFAALAERGGLRELVQQDDWNWPNQLRIGATIPAADYLQSLRLRRRLQEKVRLALAEVDVYVTIPNHGPSLLWTNLTGHPEVVLRCGQTADHLPISLSFVGNIGREDAALRLALAYEQTTPWHDQWPDTTQLPAEPPPLTEKG